MQKNARDVGEDSIRDIRLYIVALLGGGLGIYLAMFIFKYRLKNFWYKNNYDLARSRIKDK